MTTHLRAIAVGTSLILSAGFGVVPTANIQFPLPIAGAGDDPSTLDDDALGGLLPGLDREALLSVASRCDAHADSSAQESEDVPSMTAADVEAAPSVVREGSASPAVDAKALRCLALNIYHEARSEPESGRLAVAAVTLNRVRSPAYPDSVCGVVRQGGERLHRCQFSWWCDGKSDVPTESRAWDQALRLARRSLLGLEEDPTGGATHYHATYVRPRWASVFEDTARIGQHIFYRSEASPEEPLQLASLELPTIN